ncbi:Non-structural maintenance of chromosome element 4, partial [Suillus cothurnatus]
LDTVDTINLFCLIIDPNDFGQSVENLYHLSFLVQDGTCSLRVAENGEPLVSRSQPCPQLGRPDGITRKQMVMESDMATWRQAIDIFDIQHPFIPHRTTPSPSS